MKSKFGSLETQILRLINKIIFLEKKSIIQHGDLRFFPSEIHLMNVIASGEDLSALDMANRLGVTKGAVSQTLSRLETKGIIIKEKDPRYKNRLKVNLTETGKEVFAIHQETQAGFQSQYSKYLSSISEKERDVIRNFLKQLEGLIDKVS